MLLTSFPEAEDPYLGVAVDRDPNDQEQNLGHLAHELGIGQFSLFVDPPP